MSKTDDTAKGRDATASYLDMPAERRAAAEAHAGLITATVRKVALDLPLGADVDDFRRILTAGGRK